MNDSLSVLRKIVENVEKVIIGKRNSVELTLMSLICGGHVLIEDVPGVGKTSLASAMSKSLNCTYKRIQFTPDILPSDITGFSMFNQKTLEFEYKPGSIMSQIILADEINRTSPKTQASLLEVMEENQVTVDGITYKVPQPFMVMATQNPIEYLGTYPLPEAQLDRFFMKISIGYPTAGEESSILNRFQYSSPLEKLDAVAQGDDIIKIQEAVKSVHADISINHYIVDIVGQTRKHPDIILGASPRGSLSLFRAAQAWAFYNQRNYILPEDVKRMALPVLSHRIMLKQEAKLKRIYPEEIINSILSKINVPMVESDEKK